MADVVELLVGARARAGPRSSATRAALRPADIPRLAGDPSRLRAATGWEPEIPLEQTLADTLDGRARQTGAGSMSRSAR